jgi:hypothetical protein
VKSFSTFFSRLRRPSSVVLCVLAIVFVGGALVSYRFVRQSPAHTQPPVAKASPVPTIAPTPTQALTPTIHATPTPAPIVLPTQSPSQIRGVAGDAHTTYTTYAGIPWIRLSYPTCGSSNLSGNVLKNTIQSLHKKNIRVLLSVCQPNGNKLFDTNLLADAAQGNADAVQCGNEQMKQDASVSFLYVPPDRFARFYDLCARAFHKVRSDIPVILGSLDPHVASADYPLLLNQVNYLDQMQIAMNTSVHPGGHWDWHSQIIGLIDSWHNGYGGANNLYDLFSFWSQQLHINLNSGNLGKHLWVIEGTGCFKGCGVPDDEYDLAVAHILALTSDVENIKQYQVPFFYFSGKDFFDQGIYWPIGILNANGHAKPIRQDLSMGAIKLTISCPHKSFVVADQETLLAKLYAGCNMPSNYVAILTS